MSVFCHLYKTFVYQLKSDVAANPSICDTEVFSPVPAINIIIRCYLTRAEGNVYTLCGSFLTFI